MVDNDCLESRIDRDSLRIAENLDFRRKNPVPPAYNPYTFPKDAQFEVVLKTTVRSSNPSEVMQSYFKGKDEYLSMYGKLTSNGTKVKQPWTKRTTVSKVDGLVMVTSGEGFFAGDKNNGVIFNDFASTMSPYIFGMFTVKDDFIFVRKDPVNVLINYLEAMQNYPLSTEKSEQAAGIRAYGQYLKEGGSSGELLDCMMRMYVAHEQGEKSLDNRDPFMQLPQIRDLSANLESAKEYERINVPRLRHGVYALLTQCLYSDAFHKKQNWHFSRALLLASLFTNNPSKFYESKLACRNNYKIDYKDLFKYMMADAHAIIWSNTHKYLNS